MWLCSDWFYEYKLKISAFYFHYSLPWSTVHFDCFSIHIQALQFLTPILVLGSSQYHFWLKSMLCCMDFLARSTRAYMAMCVCPLYRIPTLRICSAGFRFLFPSLRLWQWPLELQSAFVCGGIYSSNCYIITNFRLCIPANIFFISFVTANFVFNTLICYRCTDTRKVWYEWCLEAPLATSIQNSGGKSYWIGLWDRRKICWAHSLMKISMPEF